MTCNARGTAERLMEMSAARFWLLLVGTLLLWLSTTTTAHDLRHQHHHDLHGRSLASVLPFRSLLTRDDHSMEEPNCAHRKVDQPTKNSTNDEEGETHHADEDGETHDSDHDEEHGRDDGHDDHGCESEDEEAEDFLTLFSEASGGEGPSEHVFEVVGVDEGSKMDLESVEQLLLAVDGVSEEGDGDGHGHGHDNDHGSDEDARYKLSGENLLAQYGSGDGLTIEEFEIACPAILACQVDENCELGNGEHDDHHDDHNNRNVGLKAMAASVFFVEVWLGTAVPYLAGRFSNIDWWRSILNSFAGGVFLATGIVHMIPEVIEEEHNLDSIDEYPLGTVTVAIGFMLVFFVEQVLFDVHAHEDSEAASRVNDSVRELVERRTQKCSVDMDDTSTEKALTARLSMPCHRSQPVLVEEEGVLRRALVLLGALSVHSVLESLSLGLQDNKDDILVLFTSIACHKLAAAIALSTRFIKEGASFKHVALFMGAFSLVAPVAIIIGIALNDIPTLAVVILNGLASGTFIYVGAYEVVHEEFSTHDISEKIWSLPMRAVRLVKFFSMLIGNVVIFLTALLPQHNH